MATLVRERTAGQEMLGDFILCFVQALLRTGYYLPTHPQARKARQGLHGRFRSLFHGRHELTFMVHDEDGRKNVAVEGVLDEGQKLTALMPAGMAEAYVPRLAHFLERKDLVSVTLKEDMGEEEFSRFVDLLSETGTEVSDAAGKEHFVARLREAGVVHFSVVFEEDLRAPERNLPWRAHLAIIDHLVPGDREQPGPNPLAALQHVGLTPEPQQRFLHHILGERHVASGEPKHIPQQRLAVCVVDRTHQWCLIGISHNLMLRAHPLYLLYLSLGQRGGTHK